VAIIGSGNIGTDLMIKILQGDGPLTLGAVVGIDPDSDALVHARRLGVPTTANGVGGLLAMPHFADIKLAFDATSAVAHRTNWAALRDTGIRMVDLTPASIGPFCVPVVNLNDHLDEPNLNMVTCGGQATVPIVSAVGKAGIVSYAEIVSSISAKSAGSGTICRWGWPTPSPRSNTAHTGSTPRWRAWAPVPATRHWRCSSPRPPGSAGTTGATSTGCKTPPTTSSDLCKTGRYGSTAKR
jgi:hypothetical protein